MRHYYLKPGRSTNAGCRGGIAANYDDYDEYELEIGVDKNCSSEMMSLCVHYDEIMEYLALCDKSPLARMLLKSIKETIKEINDGLKNSTL